MGTRQVRRSDGQTTSCPPLSKRPAVLGGLDAPQGPRQGTLRGLVHPGLSATLDMQLGLNIRNRVLMAAWRCTHAGDDVARG